MRPILATAAKLGLLGAVFALSGAGMSTPSYAKPVENPNCYYSNRVQYCPGSRDVPGSSGGTLPDRCNGELGFWDVVTFANGKTLCIPRSTADFYHNGTSSPTCTISYWVGDVWTTSTSDGACQPPVDN